MKPEAQRISIAEACGWTAPTKKIPQIKADGSKEYDKAAYWVSHWGIEYFKECPDYLNDLNAMHEAEKTLEVGPRLWYGEWLHKILALGYELDDDTKLSGWSVFDTAHATAAQRAEAFLRTIGKWEDDK